MQEQLLYADVILPFPLGKPFTYEIPDNFRGDVGLLKRVVVPFGRKRLYSGIVVNIHSDKPKHVQIKQVLDVIDQVPVINEIQLRFWWWMANYYMCTIGEVLKAALPAGLKLESETKVIYTGTGTLPDGLTDEETIILEILKDKPVISIQALSGIIKKPNLLKTIRFLVEKNLVTLDEKIKEAYKPKKGAFITLTSEYDHKERLNHLLNDLSRAPKQLDLLLKYLSMSEYFRKGVSSVEKNELLKKSDATNFSLKALQDKGVFSTSYKELGRLEGNGKPTEGIKPLSAIQQRKLEEINASFQKKNVALFHGVTSSGKTEVYIHLISAQVKAGKQVLYLLPEIALTTQIINRLKAVFGGMVGVYHSKFNDAERVEVYQKVLKFGTVPDESFPIILGVRSSVFLPFTNLGLVIVDEEHENTYKQFDPAPRYHARDSAIVLASMHNASVLLGTATPSIESFYNAQSGKYGYVGLTTRFREVQLPKIQLVDLLENRKKKKMKSMFSATLITSIEQTLNEKEQVILFQNRRGFSPYLECSACGWIPYCIHCDVTLTYHKFTNTLVCHYCGYSLKKVVTCRSCGCQTMETRGFGTEKIEDEAAILFPQARIKRMDLDATRKKKAYEDIISGFEQHRIDILIGTQMLSKGLDFTNVGLVGILNADNMLQFPDFRAHERSFQLMVQVGGRAGRLNKQGKVIIQTSHPNHNIIQCVLDNQYMKMYTSQIAERRQFQYPPFYRLVRISLKHKDKAVVERASEKYALALRKHFGQKVVGPEFPLVNRVQSWYIKQVYVKIKKGKSFEKVKGIMLDEVSDIKSGNGQKSLQVQFDVDPM